MSVRRRRGRIAAILVAAAASAATLAPVLANAAPSTYVASVPVGPRHGLTVSNGSPWVWEQGSWVNFHTAVRDLAWNPAGTKAAFVDGWGNLEVANPDGSGRVVVAKNPGGEVWSHPTWQVQKAYYSQPAKNNLIFVASRRGVLRLEIVQAAARNATPALLPLYGHWDGGPAVPQTANNWPNGGGTAGTVVYDNQANGEVYIRDDNLRASTSRAIFQGSEPALSPDGSELLFVRSVGGHDHVFEAKLFVGKPVAVDITPHAIVNFTEPAFYSELGDIPHIALRTPTGIDEMGDFAAGGPLQVTTVRGLPAFRT